jgi:hypothetical protein
MPLTVWPPSWIGAECVESSAGPPVGGIKPAKGTNPRSATGGEHEGSDHSPRSGRERSGSVGYGTPRQGTRERMTRPGRRNCGGGARTGRVVRMRANLGRLHRPAPARTIERRTEVARARSRLPVTAPDANRKARAKGADSTRTLRPYTSASHRAPSRQFRTAENRKDERRDERSRIQQRAGASWTRTSKRDGPEAGSPGHARRGQ